MDPPLVLTTIKPALLLSFPFSSPPSQLISFSSHSMAYSNSRVSVFPQQGFLDPSYAEIVVIRHGETEWNIDGRLQGQLDVNLNQIGRQQALVVADRLSKEPKIAAVYSSDLKRACDTAETIAKKCGIHQVTKEPKLRERHVGVLQGVISRDAAELHPEAYSAWMSSRKDQEIPGGGESLNQLYDRSTSALQRIANKHQGERVVVVSHDITIRALYRRAVPHGKSIDKVVNTSVNTFHISDDNEWRIKSWGDVSHLMDHSDLLVSAFDVGYATGL